VTILLTLSNDLVGVIRLSALALSGSEGATEQLLNARSRPWSRHPPTPLSTAQPAVRR